MHTLDVVRPFAVEFEKEIRCLHRRDVLCTRNVSERQHVGKCPSRVTQKTHDWRSVCASTGLNLDLRRRLESSAFDLEPLQPVSRDGKLRQETTMASRRRVRFSGLNGEGEISPILSKVVLNIDSKWQAD